MNQRTSRSECVFHLIATCVVMLLGAAGLAAPATTVVQGKLAGPGGLPLSGARVWQIRFYDAPVGGAQLGSTLSDTVVVAATGRFAIEIAPPPAVLAATGDVYYELAIDSAKPPDGLIGPADVFPGRVKVNSTMWSFKAADADTLDGQHTDAFATASHAHTEQDTLDSVAARGRATSRELRLTSGSLMISPAAPPAAMAQRLVNTSSSLYWNGAPLMTRTSQAFVMVQTANNASSNGTNLIAAYAQARQLKPFGQDLTTTNRACVLVPPGRYDMKKRELVMDTEFVDLVGMSTARDDQYIYGLTPGTGGVLRQTADDVRIENLVIENQYPWPSGVAPFCPAAYYPDDGSTHTVVRNCEFRGGEWQPDGPLSMRAGTVYAGTYENCVAGYGAFGGFQGAATGKFINCTGGDFSFGSVWGGTASGTFIQCTGGASSFGSHESIANGTFIDCTGGDDSFGSQEQSRASGTFTNCIGGNYAFGGARIWDGATTASGTFIGCRGGDNAFGGGYALATGTFKNCGGGKNAFGCGVSTGTYTDCTGGSRSFGGGGIYSKHYPTALGTYTNCTGGDRAFGGGDGAAATGTFTNCTGGARAFGGGEDGAATGSFTHCTGGDYAFGGDGWFANVGSTTATLTRGCQMTGTVWTGKFAGRMEDCRWGTGMKLEATARIYRSTFLGTLDLNNKQAGVTQSCACDIIDAGLNIFGATNAAALNIANPEVK